MVAETFRTPWFEVKGSSALAQSRSGTRPGMPLADFIFNISFKPVQDDIHSRLGAAGLLLQLDKLPDAKRVFRAADGSQDATAAQGSTF
eukprot:3068742-Pyramimonas_sp.AAC.1